jgi:uncharacterized protein (DUF433 family)
MRESLIVSDPEILNGKPVIKGTRISVALVLQCLASGMTREDILRSYPTVTQEGIDAALDFGKYTENHVVATKFRRGKREEKVDRSHRIGGANLGRRARSDGYQKVTNSR